MHCRVGCDNNDSASNMQRITAPGTVNAIVVVLCVLAGSSTANIERLELVMPRYAVRGGSALLRCVHSVAPEQLYKVEWQRAGAKIFQYIKDRKPPFRYFPMAGAELNKTNSNERQLQLTELNFSASGAYSCVVSTETPIFSKDSDVVSLTVIEPQNADPIIAFDKTTYEVGDVLRANCTTAAARPPPHITWLINDEKVDDALTRTLGGARPLNGHGYFEQRAAAAKQLAVRVSELHAGADGVLRLTCMATIPGYVVAPGERYADERRHSVHIEVVMSEVPPAEIVSGGSAETGDDSNERQQAGGDASTSSSKQAGGATQHRSDVEEVFAGVVVGVLAAIVFA